MPPFTTSYKGDMLAGAPALHTAARTINTAWADMLTPPEELEQRLREINTHFMWNEGDLNKPRENTAIGSPHNIYHIGKKKKNKKVSLFVC